MIYTFLGIFLSFHLAYPRYYSRSPRRNTPGRECKHQVCRVWHTRSHSLWFPRGNTDVHLTVRMDLQSHPDKSIYLYLIMYESFHFKKRESSDCWQQYLPDYNSPILIVFLTLILCQAKRMTHAVETKWVCRWCAKKIPIIAIRLVLYAQTLTSCW